jgi:hypothetical protein
MDRIADYIALAVAIHSAALIVVNLTPTPRDNAALGTTAKASVKIYRAIEILAGVITPLVKR